MRLTEALQHNPPLQEFLTNEQVLRVAVSSIGWLADDAFRLLSTFRPTTPTQAYEEAYRQSAPSAIETISSLLALEEIDTVWTNQEIGEWADVHHAELLEVVRNGNEWRGLPTGALRGLAAVKNPSPAFVEAVLEAGLRFPRKYRREFYAILAPDGADLVRPLLLHKQLPYRTGAVEWVRFLKDPDSEANLRAMIRKERNQYTKGIALATLEEIGGSLEEFISPERLEADARKAMLKENPIPKELGWLNFSSLPQLRWQDGSPVPLDIVRWFCSIAVKAKDAEPSPIIRRHFDSMEPNSVREFGNALFQSYVRQDLRPAWDRATAEAKATAIVNWFFNPTNRLAPADLPPREVLYERHLQRFLEEPGDSLVECKNLLAVVAATGATDVIDQAYRYMKKWRGYRLAQGRAMVQMIAHVDDPKAIQILLAMSRRFRPRTFQKEAAKQVELLAERKDWTVAELADRSTPDGDFDTTGRQTIDYGVRTFTAHLTDALKVELTNDATGRAIKSLPAANAADDEDLVKAAKSDFSAAKKEVKAVLKLQPDRLHEAMCTERKWEAGDFERYVLLHPLMVRLATRLVWTAQSPAESRQFRPLSDGTLLSVDDAELTIDRSASISLAHDQTLEPSERDAWVQHLADYEVTPLFAQFNRPTITVEDGQMTLVDFEGHLIDALVLRRQVDKVGWQMGPAEDGGYSSYVERQFPLAGISALLGHWGVPPESRPYQTAFSELWFQTSGNGRTRRKLLSDVPPILLQETYAQAQKIVAAGTGFDPDYQKKVG